MSRLAALALVAIAACGYPPLDHNSGNPDAHLPDGPPGCVAPATFATPTMSSQAAKYYPPTQELPEELSYVGKLDSGSPADFLEVALVETQGGPFEHGPTTATITLTGSEASSATCAGCVLVVAKCSNCGIGVDNENGTPYLANGGQLQITSVNPNITGTLSNVTLTHVNIDAQGNSSPAADGCTTKIASASFTATVN